MGHRLPILKRISDFADCNFFIISYRGYGESEGSPHEAGIRKDAQAAFDYVVNERKDEIDPSRIIIYGQSIGGAVSIDLVARNQAKIAALIIENTFLSLPKLIPHVMPWLAWARDLCHQKWNSEARLYEIIESTLPRILFLSGSQDELIPQSHMQELFRIATSTDEGLLKCRMEVFEKGTHNDTCMQPGYFEAVANFISTVGTDWDSVE